MLDGAAGLRTYLLTTIHVLFVLLGFGAGLVVGVSFGGPLGVFVRSYAMVYYGGHYKALGNLLEPSASPAATAESVTAEQRTEDPRRAENP